MNESNVTKPSTKDKQEIYYHYTSLEALYGIVTSRTFRMSYLKYTNDKKELFYNSERFLEDVTALYENENRKSIKEMYDRIRMVIKAQKSDFDKIANDIKNPYALCLSQKKDNLTHWDRYANRMKGVCIGINTRVFDSLYKKMNVDIFANGILEMGKVFYNNEDIRNYIKTEIFEYFLRCQDDSTDGKIIKNIIMNNFYIIPAVICQHLIRFTKVESFIDEDEFRIYHDTATIERSRSYIKKMNKDPSISKEIYNNLLIHFNQTIKHLKLNREYIISGDKGICEYANLCLEEVWGTDAIPEIVIGPLCRTDRNTLRRFLSNNGLKGVRVSYSKVPIR